MSMHLCIYGVFEVGNLFKTIEMNRIMSCLLKRFIRKIKITVNRRFDVSNIILKIEIVYANVKVVMRELKILNM